MEALSIIEKKGPNYILMELTGSLNGYTIGEFTEKMYNYIKEQNVVLDLNSVLQIDSAAMGVIFATINDSEEYKTKVFIMNPSESARKAFDKTGFTDDFNIIHSVTEVSDVS
jgi:anti-anti-sigma factor